MKAQMAWVAFKTIVRREVWRTFRVWRQSFLPGVVSTVLYFLIFGQVIGGRIGLMSGFSYLRYIAPGLIMMQIITSAYNSSVSGFFIAKFQRQIQELLVSPLTASLIVLGFTASAVLRGVIAGIIATVVSLFFAHIRIYDGWIMLSIVLCSSCLFALAGLINAVYAKTFDDITVIPTFVLTPLIYLGGVFYAIHSLPPIWQSVSLVNPIAYIINAFRFGILGIADTSIALAFLIVGIFILLLFILAYYLINQGKSLRE
jgi:ABC-2 type transport system permease protein